MGEKTEILKSFLKIKIINKLGNMLMINFKEDFKKFNCLLIKFWKIIIQLMGLKKVKE